MGSVRNLLLYNSGTAINVESKASSVSNGYHIGEDKMKNACRPPVFIISPRFSLAEN
jgi:hypothetical protein